MVGVLGQGFEPKYNYKEANGFISKTLIILINERTLNKWVFKNRKQFFVKLKGKPIPSLTSLGYENIWTFLTNLKEDSLINFKSKYPHSLIETHKKHIQLIPF